MNEERTCYNCTQFLKCKKKPKAKLYPYYAELTCHESHMDRKG